MSQDNGGPAFPMDIQGLGVSTGMTLLDYFAGQALQGITASYAGTEDFPYGLDSEAALAKRAYEFAKYMLAERARRMK